MNLLQDLKFAARSLRSHAGTTAFATVTLALGLGAALAIYAVVDAVLLRDLPYPGADRLVQIRELADDGHAMNVAYPNYTDLVASADALDASAYYGGGDGPVSSGDTTTRAYGTLAGGDFFRVLGVAPELGRTFDANERDKVAVISHALWQGLLHGRPDVLGRTINVGGEEATIVGVMPAGFAFPGNSATWTPFLDDPGTSRTAHNWSVIARLHDANDLSSVRLAANALATRLRKQLGSQTDAAAFDVTPLADAIAAPVRSALLLLAGGTLFLLLIAVTNAANLLLALNGSRSRELAVRAALGASRGDIARQIFAECALIASAALILGGALAIAAIRVLAHGGGTELPRASEIGIGPGATLVAVFATFAIAIATTAAVLWSQRRRSTIGELRESGRGQSPGRSHLRLRLALLIGQTALTTVLLVGTGLLGRSFLALLAIDPGFDADSAMSVSLSRPWTRDSAAAAETARRYETLIDALRAVPGITAVGGVNALPLGGDGANGAFWDGSVTDTLHAPSPIGYAEFRVATADYFKAAGIKLVAGRAFDERDRSDGDQVAVISAAAARATWGDADPIGKRIQYGNMDGDAHVLTIVGVVGDVRERRLDHAPSGTVYVNLAQRPLTASEFSLVVRSNLPLVAIAPTLRRIVDAQAGDIPHALAPLSELRASALADRKLGLVLLGAFATVAFALAVGGLYGLMAFAVGQREHEFALRQALGATREQVARLVLGSGLAIGAAGVAAGIALALASARVVGSQLYGVAATDPVTLAGVAILLLGTILVACFVPARRASAIAPREALG
ncbi:MAG TPA: ADOP family duplicated permease [Rhodanobacteraceae bacterium]|jgi:predicted permease|nr:ADOP family duplicated permease [Rhodanobacteraceae bacterium]